MFCNCRTKEEAKKLFRRLALRLHPDHGGESDLMILLQDSYESHLKFMLNNKVDYESSGNQKNMYQTTCENICDGEEELNIIDEIIEYSETNKKFDRSFVDSVREFLENNGYVTSSQYNAMVKVYYAFRMDRKAEK